MQVAAATDATDGLVSTAYTREVDWSLKSPHITIDAVDNVEPIHAQHIISLTYTFTIH